jgi:hypothetical protein
MDTGWTANQTAVSSYFNYLGYWTYQWLSYFDAGIWQDDLEVQGTLHVTGAVDFDTTLNVDGATTLVGAATLTAGIANNVTLTLGATAAAGQSFTVSSTGRYKHGVKEIPFGIDYTDCITSTVSVTRAGGTAGVNQAAGGTAYYKLPVVWGIQRLQDIEIYGSSVGSPTFTLMKYDYLSSTYVAVAGASDTMAAGVASLIPTTPAAGDSVYVLKVVTTGNSVDIGSGVMSVDVP